MNLRFWPRRLHRTHCLKTRRSGFGKVKALPRKNLWFIGGCMCRLKLGALKFPAKSKIILSWNLVSGIPCKRYTSFKEYIEWYEGRSYKRSAARDAVQKVASLLNCWDFSSFYQTIELSTNHPRIYGWSMIVGANKSVRKSMFPRTHITPEKKGLEDYHILGGATVDGWNPAPAHWQSG